jgi:hypothetical protein
MENKCDSSYYTQTSLDRTLMNEELIRWMEETTTETPEPKTSKPLKPSGKCQICGKKDAKSICLKCSRGVCVSCYFKIIGVCQKCVPKELVEKWMEKHPDWEKILGVEWVE